MTDTPQEIPAELEEGVNLAPDETLVGDDSDAPQNQGGDE